MHVQKVHFALPGCHRSQHFDERTVVILCAVLGVSHG